MRIIVLLVVFLIEFTYADVDPESIYPRGCKRKGNLIKCPIRPYNAGEIYDLEKKLVYEYYPKGEGQTEMASTVKCKNIMPYPTEEWSKNHNREDYGNISEFLIEAINAKEFFFFCEERVSVKSFFCQDDKRRVLIIKYDDLGIEDERIMTTTDNPRYCKEKFDKKFK